MDILFPVLFSLIAGTVSFASSSYALSYYRARYEIREFKAALIIGIGTFVLFSTMFYGGRVFEGKAGEDVIGGLMIIVIVVTIVSVFITLGRRDSST